MLFTDTYARQIDPEVTPDSSLGVTSDMSQKELNQILLDKISELNNKIASLSVSNNLGGATLSAKDLNADISVSDMSTSMLDSTINDYFFIKAEKTTLGIDLEWDLSDFMTSIPSNLSIRKISVLGDSGKTIVFQSSSAKEVRKIVSGNLPLTLEVGIRVSDGDKSFMYTATKIIESESISLTKVKLNSGSIGPIVQKNLSQSEFNKQIQDRVNRLENINK